MNTNFSNLRGDLSGGLASAVMALPGNMIYGLIAFAPLGPGYAGQGILAGIYASVFAGLTAALLGGPHGMISGPRAPTVIVFASVVGQVLASGILQGGDALPTAVALGFATVLLSGILQLLFVALRLDRLVKYLSFLVIAGVMNGTAVLIAYGALRGCLGLSTQSFLDLCADPGQIRLGALAVALLSAILWARGTRLVPWIPGALLALLGGCGLHYALLGLGLRETLGGTIASVPGRFPVLPSLSRMAGILGDQTQWPLLPIVLYGALTIAILSAIESSLAVLTIQNLSGGRASARRELMAQGIGNMLNGLLGAIPAGGAASRVLVNYKAGGRTWLSGVAFGVISLLGVLLFSSLIGHIPSSVVGGMSLVVAGIVFDKWSLKLARRLFARNVANRSELFSSMAVILGVMFTLLYFNIMVAVALGMALGVFLFVERMSLSVIGHVLSGTIIHSKKQRNVKVMEILEHQGYRIAVVELRGAVFFGAADRLYETIDCQVEKGVDFVVLDMKRVSTVDLSGARVLEQAYKHFTMKGVTLIFSYIHPESPFWDLMKDVGFHRAVRAEHIFTETDLALEYCEERVMELASSEYCKGGRCSLVELFGMDGRGDEGLMEAWSPYLEKMRFRAGDVIFREGDPSDGVYLVTEGAAAVVIRVPGAHRRKRLTVLSYGTMFGEMSLLDRGQRSATIEALENLVCYRISTEDFERMKQRDPDLALMLLNTLARFLISYLRRATKTLGELER